MTPNTSLGPHRPGLAGRRVVAVPKERVQMGKETVTEEQTVSEEVRKEQIDAEGAGAEGKTGRE